MQSTFFDTVGTPLVNAASSFLLGNPVTSSFFQSLADDPNTQQILGAVKAVADVIAPLETAALVRQHLSPALVNISQSECGRVAVIDS